MKLISDWRNKKLRCHFCGEIRSVKYTMKFYDPVVDDKPTDLCVCNKCALQLQRQGSKRVLGRYVDVAKEMSLQ